MDEFDYSPNLPDVETRTNLYRGLIEHLDKVVFGEKFDLPRSESGQYTAALNPVEAFDRTKFPEGMIFSEPDTKWTESQIRGLPSKLAKVVRKAKQANENYYDQAIWKKLHSDDFADLSVDEKLTAYDKMKKWIKSGKSLDDIFDEDIF